MQGHTELADNTAVAVDNSREQAASEPASAVDIAAAAFAAHSEPAVSERPAAAGVRLASPHSKCRISNRPQAARDRCCIWTLDSFFVHRSYF